MSLACDLAYKTPLRPKNLYKLGFKSRFLGPQSLWVYYVYHKTNVTTSDRSYEKLNLDTSLNTRPRYPSVRSHQVIDFHVSVLEGQNWKEDGYVWYEQVSLEFLPMNKITNQNLAV